MNFRKRVVKDEPEINFIPLIDVLLVILIFLMVTTTYSKVHELNIQLPIADSKAMASQPHEIIVDVASRGEMHVGAIKIAAGDKAALIRHLRDLNKAAPGQTVIINADAQATHQSVILVMEAAQEVGLTHLTFAVVPSMPTGKP